MYLSAASITSILRESYSLEGELGPLKGYDEQNSLFTSRDGRKWVVKVATGQHDHQFLEAQSAIMDYLQATPVAGFFQCPLPNKKGQPITPVTVEGKRYFIRVLDYLEGDFLVDLPHHSPELLRSIGTLLGRMDKSLSGFAHPAMHRIYEWDISNALQSRDFLPFIADHERRRMAGYFLLQFETEVLPLLTGLRKAYVHNDANDHNILVLGDRASGLIDFGDMVYTALANNVAVACTYAMLSKEEPLAAAVELVSAYHAEYPLTAAELDLIYYLVAGRLCISVGRAAMNRSKQSDNAAHFVTEEHAWALLYQLMQLNPIKMQDALRRACGYGGVIREGDHYEQLLEERRAKLGRNLSISYLKKLKIVRGALQYLYDDKGRTYVDCVNNVSHVGHCHPVVVKNMQRQIATLNTNTRYLNDHLVEYAKMLTDTLPSGLNVCYFTNSGSEANDLAIRMSRHFTGKKDVIVLDHAYHGTSTTCIEMSPYKFDGKGGFGQMPYIHKAMNPDAYRGVYRGMEEATGIAYAKDVERILQELEARGGGAAAFICETLLGVGGQIPLPPAYLSKVYGYARAAGTLCIADEVQVGFGRVGKKFWGFELQGVVPDIVVMGKPIGNGHPLAAVVVREEIADAFNNGMEYFNTYGGNPVSMVTGKSVLQVIQEEHMQLHAEEVGEYLMAGLRRLMDHHPIIGDVRGSGLFIGAELVRDRYTLEPAVPEIDQVVEGMKNRGYLLSTDGPLYNVLKIKPPLVFNRANADGMLRHLDEVLYSLGL